MASESFSSRLGVHFEESALRESKDLRSSIPLLEAVYVLGICAEVGCTEQLWVHAPRGRQVGRATHGENPEHCREFSEFDGAGVRFTRQLAAWLRQIHPPTAP